MNEFSIFVVEENPIQKIKYDFRGRALERPHSVTIESSDISDRASIPFKKIAVNTETTILDIIKDFKKEEDSF